MSCRGTEKGGRGEGSVVGGADERRTLQLRDISISCSGVVQVALAKGCLLCID